MADKKETQFSIDNQKQIVGLLKDYKQLLDMGVITQEEFDAKKKELLESPATPNISNPEPAPQLESEEEKPTEKPVETEKPIEEDKPVLKKNELDVKEEEIEELKEEGIIYNPINSTNPEKEKFEKLDASFETEEIASPINSDGEHEEELSPISDEAIKAYESPKQKEYVPNPKCRKIEIITAIASPALLLLFFILISTIGNPPYFSTFTSIDANFIGIFITVFLIIRLIGDAGYLTFVLLNKKAKTKVIRMLFAVLSVACGFAFLMFAVADYTFNFWLTSFISLNAFVVSGFNFVITLINKRDSLKGTNARRPFWIIPVTIGGLFAICYPIVIVSTTSATKRNQYFYAMSVLEDNPEEAASYFYNADYKDSYNQYYFAQARLCFLNDYNDYHERHHDDTYTSGIHYMLNGNGSVKVNFYVDEEIEKTIIISNPNDDWNKALDEYVPVYGTNTFYEWKISDYSFSDNNYSVTLDLHATWEEDEFEIHFSANNFSLGYITWYDSDPNYNPGSISRDIKDYKIETYRRHDQFFLTAVCYSGATFDHWEINGKLYSYSSSFHYNVEKHASIVAIFK